ncbi:MAG: RsmD family RNA methyltransferase [Bacteroidaceae bacterium]|nr:RsmD family RNA methyltransferase [Bacteroidaceae bacterium]
MRVITGKYKGRHFEVPRHFKARPTTDFAKENIFNVLRGYIDFDDQSVRALDLFSGTGSITLELLSRGCGRVVSVEKDALHHGLIRRFLEQLGDTAGVALRADVFRFVEKCRDQFDFIFADPPYSLPDLEKLPDLILQSSLLAPDGLFVLEHGKVNDFSLHPNFVEHRAYGSVNFTLFRHKRE